MSVVTSSNGCMTIDRIQTDNPTYRVLAARGIYEVRENVPFQILSNELLKMAFNDS